MRRLTADGIAAIFDRIAEEGMAPVWISLADREAAVARARTVDPSLPLAGIPFAVKDNIDVAGMTTTAGCPSFGYAARTTATAVERLLDAGAILIGKTNLDQFATGLVGTRSPYGACSSVFDDRYISGGSSSGSAVAVASGLCAFALGTDTAGSGRVPAAFNGLVGMKPTRGAISTAGVVPACRSLDCVSVFASSVADAASVWRIARGFDPKDPYSRPFAPPPVPALEGAFRFGVPADDDLEFFGDDETPHLFAAAAERLEQLGGTRVPIDFTPFREAAALLYAGPWVAERFAAVGEFIERRPHDLDPVVAGIIAGGRRFSAVEAFRAQYRLEALRHAAAVQWSRMDVLLLPTAGTIYQTSQVLADPIALNSNLGYYTNFVNLLDLAAIAVPAGFRGDGLPFGISLIGPAFTDRELMALAGRMLAEQIETHDEDRATVRVAVVGAHLAGQPLNHQLVDRGGRLIGAFRTAPDYRLFALAGGALPKPGLLREPGFPGPGIDVEVWAVPEARFGSFVAAVPPPLGIGSVQLADGAWVKGFVCEPWALATATDITTYGGWRAYLTTRG
ncbi:MAG: allophanate hydrolase [Vicinamibacterales bacterium]